MRIITLNCPVAHFSEEQYLTMIAMLRAPSYFNPRTHPKESTERMASLKHLLGNCAKLGIDPVFERRRCGTKPSVSKIKS
jgi:hypothetical protein